MPVRTSPSPITNNVAMSTTIGSLKPASASGTLMMPHNGRTTIARRATTSMRGLLTTNNPTQASSRPITKSNSEFIAALNLQSEVHSSSETQLRRRLKTRASSTDICGSAYCQTPFSDSKVTNSLLSRFVDVNIVPRREKFHQHVFFHCVENC